MFHQAIVQPTNLRSLDDRASGLTLPSVRFEPIEHLQRLAQPAPAGEDFEADVAEFCQPALASPQVGRELSRQAVVPGRRARERTPRRQERRPQDDPPTPLAGDGKGGGERRRVFREMLQSNQIPAPRVAQHAPHLLLHVPAPLPRQDIEPERFVVREGSQRDQATPPA